MLRSSNRAIINRLSAVMTVVLVVFTVVSAVGAADPDDGEGRVEGPRYDASGQLLLDDGWRRWVFIGAPLTPNSLNDGKAPFPEFHNGYMARAAFDHFLETGKFPNGTMIAKELLSIGETEAVSGSGFFPGRLPGAGICRERHQTISR